MAVVRLPRPLPAQQRICESEARNRLLVAGVGAGKTHGLCYLALRAAAMQPGVPGLIAAPTYRLLADVVLPSWQELIPDSLYTWQAAKRTILLSNGTPILCRGLDAPMKRIVGLNLGWALVDEAGQLATVLAVRMLQQRLRAGDPALAFLALFTSPHGRGWLSEWSERVDDEGRPLVHVEHATTYDNPHLSRQYVAACESEFPPGTLLHEQEMLGRFIVHRGVIYAVFDPIGHSSETAYDPDLPYELGVDFGYRSSAWLAFQYQRGRWHAVYELLPDSEFTEVSAQRVVDDLGRAPVSVYCDTPSRANTRTGLTDVEALRRIMPGADVRVVAGHRRKTTTRHKAVSAALATGALVLSTSIAPRRLVGGERGVWHALQTLEWPTESTRIEKHDETDPRKHAIDALEFWTVSRIEPRMGTPQGRSEMILAA